MSELNFDEAQRFCKKNKKEIIEMAKSGDSTATNIIDLHRMIVKCPKDHAAATLFICSVEDYIRKRNEDPTRNK